MKMKGEWDSGTTYAVGDVVRYTDGVMYHLQKPCVAGITPLDTLYWGQTGNQEILSMMADLMADLAEATEAIEEVEQSIPTNISDEAITLSTDTADYLITVDDSGDTPELAVTAIEEEVEGDADN